MDLRNKLKMKIEQFFKELELSHELACEFKEELAKYYDKNKIFISNEKEPFDNFSIRVTITIEHEEDFEYKRSIHRNVLYLTFSSIHSDMEAIVEDVWFSIKPFNFETIKFSVLALDKEHTIFMTLY